MEMKIKDGAKAFIKNEKIGKYLFFLRDNKLNIPSPNTYALLGGGIEDGETPMAALEREIKEESNIVIYDIRELGSQNFSYMAGENGMEKAIPAKVTHFLAKTDATLDTAKLFEGQHLEYFTLEEALEKNLAPATREAINIYREKLT